MADTPHIPSHKAIKSAMERLAVMKDKLAEADKAFQMIGYPTEEARHAFYPYELVDIVNAAADAFWTTANAALEESRGISRG